MENLNIHESPNPNANTQNLTPAELLDCCLVGRLLTVKPIRFNTMKDRMSKLWQPSHGVTISAIEENRFMFQLYHHWDMERIYQGGPWLFENHMLVLRKLEFGEEPTTVALDSVDVWVQVHQLPFGFMNEQIGLLIGSHLGKSIKYDDTNNYSPWRKYMRLRVAINTQEPLKTEWSFEREQGAEVKVIFKYEKLGNFCFVCGILGHTENSCRKKHEVVYIGAERKWGNFIRAENGFLGGGAAPNKWLRGGLNTVADGLNGATGTAASVGTNNSINVNRKHSLFGRIKVVCYPKTKKMAFFKGTPVNDSDLQWSPLTFTDQNKQETGSSSRGVEQERQNRDIITVENVRAVQEIRGVAERYYVTAPSMLEPTGPISYMPVQTRNRQTQGNTSSQLSIMPAAVTKSAPQGGATQGQSSKNEGMGGIPKKRLRLEGELEDITDTIGDINMQEAEGSIEAKEGDGITNVHDNPLFSVNNVKAGPVKQACLKK
ncbi:hypothetical protein QL285_043886 [Trifolium repens]|nr:hypothetical protein QL285_043886 [Trifolium repens]